MGVRTDVAKGFNQTLARAWSVAFYEDLEKPDGIIYPSRLNGHINLAAVVKLRIVWKIKLIAAPVLASVLSELKVVHRRA